MTALGVGYAARQELVGEPRAPYLRVAVLAPHVSAPADHPEIASLAVAVRNAVIAGVRTHVGLDLVPRDDIETYIEGVTRNTGRPPAQSEIRIAVGADEIITTDMTCLPDSCTVTLERTTAISGGPPPESFQLAADRAARPGETVAFHLSRLYPDHLRERGALGSIAPQDHERFVALVAQYWAGGAARSPAELLAQLEDIRAHAPRSLDVLLFEAEVRRHRYLETEDRAEAERAIALLRGADQLFPDTYDILSARFDIVLSARPHDEPDALLEASALLDRLVTLDPDSSTTHLQRAKLLAARGKFTEASRELDAAAGRDAFSWRVLYHRALVSRKQGDRIATRKAIAELLARSPGNYAGLSLLAREEQREPGRLACAAKIYEELVAREPLYHECAWLGYTRSQLGRYREASDGFRCALAIRPDDPTSRLNLAESLLVAGDTEGAGEQLRALHELLVRKRDASPEPIVGVGDALVDAQSLAYLGRGDRALAHEARVRVSQLLTLPVRPDVLYTAAVVHAVLGDRDLAARYVTRSLDAGASPTDFGLPWFDDLRRDPVLGKRLAVPVVAQTCEASAAL
jgi:tetratricopeptide (TPR) repeat protein